MQRCLQHQNIFLCIYFMRLANWMRLNEQTYILYSDQCLWSVVRCTGIKRTKVYIYIYTRVSQFKILNMFYLVIYWTLKVNHDFIFLCSIVLPPVGHSSNHEYHCWNLQDNRAVVPIFIPLLRFSRDSPSYNADVFRIWHSIIFSYFY